MRLGDEDLTRLPMHRRARRGVGYLPQEASIFRKLTVRQNFTAVLEALGVGRAERERAGRRAARASSTSTKVADEPGRAALRRRAAPRRGGAQPALNDPRYILFDEPFAGVDPIAVGELQRLIGSLRDRGIGVLLTDHNVREALGICDRAYILSAGQILEEGTPAAHRRRAPAPAPSTWARSSGSTTTTAPRGPRMSLELKQHLKMTQQLVMTPQLQQAIKLLQLSRLELVDLIRTEINENPLLDEAPSEEEERAEGASPAEARLERARARRPRRRRRPRR